MYYFELLDAKISSGLVTASLAWLLARLIPLLSYSSDCGLNILKVYSLQVSPYFHTASLFVVSFANIHRLFSPLSSLTKNEHDFSKKCL